MSDFGELKEAVKRAIQRTAELSNDGSADLADSTIEYYIKRAIDHYKSRSLKFNQASTTSFPIVATTGTITVPSDFLAPIIWRITQSGFTRTIRRKSYVIIESSRNLVTSDTTPSIYAFYEGAFEFFPQADIGYTTKLSYVKELTALSADTDTNGWTEDGENLIRNKALAYIYLERLKDSKNGNEYKIASADELSKVSEEHNDVMAVGEVQFDSYLGEHFI